MDLAEERLRQYCDDRLAEPRAEVPVPLQEVNIDAAQEQAAMVNTIPKIPQAAAGSGPTYVGVQDPAALRSPQRSNRSLSKASSPCLLNDCASNRSSPASSLYRRQSSDLATESLPALPPTETPRQLLPQQVEDTLDISFGLGTQGHEAEAARAAPSSPAEKPPAEPAEVVTVAQMEKPSAEPEVSEDPWEEILGSLAEVAPPRVSKADVWTKESSGDAECNFNSTLESSKEKEVEVEVEDEAEVSLQKPAESLEVKPDVHVDAPLAKPPEVEELHSELSEAETPAQKSATESPEVKVEGFPTDLSEVKPGTQVDGPLAEPPEAMVQTEVEELHSELSEAEMPAQKLATESPEAKADMQVVRSPTDVSEVDMLLAEPPEALVQTEVEKLHSELSEAEMPAQKPATESPEVKADMQVVRSPTDVSEVDMPLAEPPEALVPTEVEELHSELSEAEMPAQKPATESPEADIHFEKQSAESSKDPWDEILGNLANDLRPQMLSRARPSHQLQRTGSHSIQAPQSASKTEAKCIDSSGDEEESYSDSEYESYEEDEEEEEEQVTERVDAGIVLVDMDSGSSSVESGHRGTRPIDTE
ncbi:unnamed protein product [Durusdinium trenchii]|uniref:Uncharacterized protein n=1 Tax=Durusdinium trenchii TaxID=1381693 RepID=A0ABP0K4W6_9DINO